MKTFLKILGAFLALIILVAVGLNLYFTDDRLKATVMPYVNDALERDVQVEQMSLSFFSTFPQPGVSIKKMSIPGETPQDTLMALDELVVGVNMFSLFGDEIKFSEVKLNNPHFTYTIYEDSTSNIDFLLSTDETESTGSSRGVNIPYFEVNNGNFGYRDNTSDTEVKLNDLNATISLRYAELIESTLDLEIGGLHAVVDSTKYVSGLPLSLSEKSTIDLENETIQLTEGTFSIKGLALNISGDIKSWSTEPEMNLAFSSSSDNFGELLRLVPEEYQEQVENLETRGSLAIDGSVTGTLTEESIPDFNLTMRVENGYLKNPDLNEPIEDIGIYAELSKDVLVIENLNAIAGSNKLTGSGSLQNPLEEDGAFTLDVEGNVNLSTVQNFYDISAFDIERMSGNVSLKANADGVRNKMEEADFNADINVENGSLKYNGVPEAIESIHIVATATQDRADIESMSLSAAKNTFSMEGTIQNPLDEASRSVDLDSDLFFDLATLKNFYPINPDTLEMSGLLTAQVTLKGKADEIEKAVQSGSINLENGMVDYKTIGKPFRDVNLESVLEGNRLTIVNASFKTGENDLKATGVVTDYLSENRSVNLEVRGHAQLDEIDSYYELEPNISSLTGSADLNLNMNGPVSAPADMAFNGTLTVNNLNAEGDSLPQPVKNLNGELVLSPESASLKQLKMKLGSSDINISGTLRHYMEYLRKQEERSTTPQLTGEFRSTYFNMDELIDWEDSSETSETPINLPDLNSSLTASIDRLIVTGVEMQNLKASASTTPKQIKLEEASINMFEGTARGSFVWDVPRPDRTTINFKGELDSLRAESFFEEYAILGEESKVHQYMSGAFSTEVDYTSQLNVYLEPVITTASMDGFFAMTKSRLKGHPVQERVAGFLNTKEFRNMALDEWRTNFDLDSGVLTMNDLRLTSGDIGLELNGTHNLVDGALDYDVKLLLPPRFKKGIASVITQQAADALTQENGTVMVPLHVGGTQSGPTVKPNEEVIKPIVKDYLKDKAGNTLKKLFGN